MFGHFDEETEMNTLKSNLSEAGEENRAEDDLGIQLKPGELLAGGAMPVAVPSDSWEAERQKWAGGGIGYGAYADE